jgi:hypothetical protein
LEEKIRNLLTQYQIQSNSLIADLITLVEAENENAVECACDNCDRLDPDNPPDRDENR